MGLLVPVHLLRPEHLAILVDQSVLRFPAGLVHHLHLWGLAVQWHLWHHHFLLNLVNPWDLGDPEDQLVLGFLVGLAPHQHLLLLGLPVGLGRHLHPLGLAGR